VARTVIDNVKGRTAELHAIRQMVDRAMEILTSPSTSIVEFGRLLDEAWARKRRLSDRVSNPAIDQVYDAAKRAGAIGGKLLGAGGGGFMLLFVRPEERARVLEALGHLIAVPFKFENAGCRIVLYQPDGL
jgi:D-glycero-alpha-D-manno-heptose-7-phosphate kinase